MAELDYHTPRLLSEWHEDIGPVLWWIFPLSEPPYVGSPLDCGHTVEIHTQIPHLSHEAMDRACQISRIFIGGWPGYHTHWTPIPIPILLDSRQHNEMSQRAS